MKTSNNQMQEKPNDFGLKYVNQKKKKKEKNPRTKKPYGITTDQY